MFAAKVLLFVFFVSSCYCRKIKHDVGIYDGYEISIKEAPYMASIQDKYNDHVCGGSIINERFVLTAAHCCFGVLHKIRVGSDFRNAGGKLYKIEKTIKHENFSYVTRNLDVALIKLSKTIKFGTKVAPISLADEEMVLPTNTIVNASGWGHIEHSTKLPSHLMRVAIPMIDRLECQRLFRNEEIITPQMICAGQKGKSPCQGDSGGPLTKGNVQVGIISFGRYHSTCGIAPGVYVNVSAVLPWIKTTIEKNT